MVRDDVSVSFDSIATYATPNRYRGTEDKVERTIEEKDVLSVVAYRDFSMSLWSLATSIRSDVFRILFGGSFVWPYVVYRVIVGGGIARLVVSDVSFLGRVCYSYHLVDDKLYIKQVPSSQPPSRTDSKSLRPLSSM